jgi:hypothetical protein
LAAGLAMGVGARPVLFLKRVSDHTFHVLQGLAAA